MRYTSGEPYADCLKSNHEDYLRAVKKGYYEDLAKARQIAAETLEHVVTVADVFVKDCSKRRPSSGRTIGFCSIQHYGGRDKEELK